MKKPKRSQHYEADRLLAVQVAYVCAAVLRVKMPITPNMIFRETRGDALESLARMIAAWVLHKNFNLTLQRAGDAMGRHRTTLTNAIQQIDRWVIEDDTDGVEIFLDTLGRLARMTVEASNVFAQCELATTPEPGMGT